MLSESTVGPSGELCGLSSIVCEPNANLKEPTLDVARQALEMAISTIAKHSM